MKIGLLIATKNRRHPLEALLESLRKQIFRDFEVWIFDQNPEGFLAGLEQEFADLNLHIRRGTGPANCSTARNELLRVCRCELIAFPDDDCCYLPDTLSRAVQAFQDHPAHGILLGQWASDADHFQQSRPRELNQYTCFRHGETFVQFYRRAAIGKIEFNPAFGLGEGVCHIGGEDTLFLCQVLRSGVKALRIPQIRILHPQQKNDAGGCRKAFAYGEARGALLQYLQYPAFFILLNLLWPFLKALRHPASWRSCLQMFRGRWLGTWRGCRCPDRQESPLRVLLRLFRAMDKEDIRSLIWLQLLCILPAILETAVAGSIALLSGALLTRPALMEQAWYQRLAGSIPLLQEQTGLCLMLLMVIALLLGLKNLANVQQMYHSARLSEEVNRKISRRILDFFIRAPYLWLISEDISAMQFSISNTATNGPVVLRLQQIITNGLIVVMLAAGIFVANWQIAAVLVPIAVLLGWSVVRLNRLRNRKAADKLYFNNKNINRALYFLLHGVKEIKLFVCGGQILDQYDRMRRNNLILRARRVLFNTTPVAMLESAGSLLLPGLFFYLCYLRHTPMPEVVVLMGLAGGVCWRMFPALNRLLSQAIDLQYNLIYLSDNMRRLEQGEKIMKNYPPAQEGLRPEFQREIEIRDLSFRYPGRDAGIFQLSFRIPKNSSVGIIGTSGSGKTTFANLFSQLLLPQSGGFLLDGVPLKPEARYEWRKMLGYVPQHPFIFNGTIAENIVFTNLETAGITCNRPWLEQCCRSANMDFLEQLADGLETVIGDNGVRLSGGQLQRISIARVLYKKPEILIFDEATSALDTKNEAVIRDTMLTLQGKMTMVIIAHRIATVENCSQIVWLENGRLQQIGTPEEVLPAYHEMMRNRHQI